MRTNATLFWILAIFFFLMDAVYVIWSLIDVGRVEWAGTMGIGLAGALGVFLAFYMGRSHAKASRMGPPDPGLKSSPRTVPTPTSTTATPSSGTSARGRGGPSCSPSRAA
jgi:hypothetical protein